MASAGVDVGGALGGLLHESRQVPQERRWRNRHREDRLRSLPQPVPQCVSLHLAHLWYSMAAPPLLRLMQSWTLPLPRSCTGER